ncbi:MAG: PHP domain-containing protein [Bacteroidia bacterium]|nr:PHP domain-containing protein [Bacteroidia bacterium]
MGMSARKTALITLAEELLMRLEIQEPDSFRLSAYRKLIETLSSLPEESFSSKDSLLSALKNKSGIGEKLLTIASQLYEKGQHPLLEQLRQEVPDGVLELRRLPGLGPKRIHQLWKQVGVASVDGLEQAFKRGKVHNLPGWGPALLRRLEEGIQFYRSQQGRMLYREALHLWKESIHPLEAEGLIPIPIGELRRALPLLSPPLQGVLPASQETRFFQITKSSLQRRGSKWLISPFVEIEFWPDEEMGIRLATEGFPERVLQADNNPFRRLCEKEGSSCVGSSEKEIYNNKLGLPYIIPAWRDWEDVFLLAEKKLLPEPLSAHHVRGTVHVHTTYSDGVDSLEAMGEAARIKGWKWLGIADHSQRAAYARGLSPARLAEQAEAIDRLNEQYAGTFRLLKGVEADILPDGRLDYDETVWKQMDFIVASIHEKLHMTAEEATARLLRAIENPYVTILGHWTGRLLRSRPGYPIDEERILRACAERGVAIEFNANPYRMEIDWKWVRRAAELGVSIILTTDAHSVEELDYWETGLAVLQKGLLPPSLLLNTSEEPPFPTKR